MFNRIATPVCLALFCVTASLSSAATAQAARYGSFVVRNPNNVSINYAIAWGDGEYEVFTVLPGHKISHYIELDENGEIPGPVIKFDAKGGDGDTLTLVDYDVDAYLVNDPEAGKVYTFRYTADGRFLDLFEA